MFFLFLSLFLSYYISKHYFTEKLNLCLFNASILFFLFILLFLYLQTLFLAQYKIIFKAFVIFDLKSLVLAPRIEINVSVSLFCF